VLPAEAIKLSIASIAYLYFQSLR